MQVRNLDYECYLDAVAKQRHHQEDWLVTGYAPKGFYVKDFCVIKFAGIYHLFHIAGTPGVTCCLPGNELWFGHATTRDFLTWETHEPCFYIDSNGWDNGHVFAPFVIQDRNRFWMFYTGVAIENRQRISVAVSEDLFHWRRVTREPLIRPERYDWAFCPTQNGAACRDPHVCRWGDEYSLYYTAVTGDGRACVARASSKNLIDWQDHGPVYRAKDLAHCESSNVQELHGKYYLFFGGHYEYWSYVVSDHFSRWPEQEPIPLKKHITAMEVIVRQDDCWLVSFFKFDNYRFFLGQIDWSRSRPIIEEIDTPAQLTQFKL